MFFLCCNNANKDDLSTPLRNNSSIQEDATTYEYDKKFSPDDERLLISESKLSSSALSPSLYGTLVRFFVRDSLFLQLCLFTCVKFKIFTQSEKSEKRLCLSNRTVQLETKGDLSKAVFLTTFLRGVNFTTEKLWPTALLGLLAHDIAWFYKFPEDRYGNTLADILLGLSNNQATWSTYFGSYLPGEYLYWVTPVALIASPIFMGLLNWLYRKNTYNNASDHLIDDDSPIHQPEDSGCFWDTVTHVLPCDFVSRGMSCNEFTILWNSQITYDKRTELLESIIYLSENYSQLIQLTAISHLANIADSFRHSDINRLIRMQPERTETFENLSNIRDRALHTLQKLGAYRSAPRSGYISPMIRYFYTNYLLWSLGRSRSCAFQFIFCDTFIYILCKASCR